MRIARRKAVAGCSRCPAEGWQSISSHAASSDIGSGRAHPLQPPRTPHTGPRRPRGLRQPRTYHPTSAQTDTQTDTRPWSAPLTYLQSRFLLEMPSDRPPPVRGELQPYRPGIAGTRPAPRQRSGHGAAPCRAPLGSPRLGPAGAAAARGARLAHPASLGIHQESG